MESWKADEKQIDEVKSEDEVESEERRCNSAKVRRKKIHPRQMLEKSRNTVFFQWFVRRVSRKVGVIGEIKNCTALWREVHFEVKMLENWGVRTTFRSYDVEKLRAAVARSTFSSENVQNTSALDHFLPFRCRKIARRCGEKYKTRQLRTTFCRSDVDKLHAAVARSMLPSQNDKKLTVSEHFLKFRCRKISQLVN